MSHPTYLQQSVSLLSTVAGYIRLPALATSVCLHAHRLCGQQPLLPPRPITRPWLESTIAPSPPLQVVAVPRPS